MNIEIAIKNFIGHCTYEKNLSPKTITAYTIDLNQFRIFLELNKYSKIIKEIDKAIIRSYLEYIKDLKAKTIKRKIATLKAMLTFLEFEDVILTNPFRKMRINIKEIKTLPVSMEIDEIKKLILESYSHINQQKSKKGYKYKEAIRNTAILELLFATGIRVSELCSLNKENINLSSRSIKVMGKGSKERILSICNEEALSALQSYENEFMNRLNNNTFYFINRFGNRISSQSVRLMVKKLAEEAKLSKNITPHTIRHTFATLLLDEDVDIRYIQHMLGHSSILVTQLYTHVSNKRQENILSSYHPRKKFTAMV